ncbi:cupin-like domain-containing protein [Pseudonocardia sp. TMWB2A]|uniref:cupin-like domain-containing protein n=1 Tax=Pseudonocardia sp. TMWB2A TaxID=687430 RepID=UPI00307D7050
MSSSDITTGGGRSAAGPIRISLAEWQDDPARWRGRRAVVVRDAFADTTAVTTWTPELLAQRFPEVPVLAKEIPLEAWADPSRASFERMDLRRFVGLLRAGGSCQIAQQPIAPFTGLAEEVQLERMAEPPYRRVYLWLGRGTRTPLHYDRIENVFVQVRGTKQFVLEPPDSAAGRYVQDAPTAHLSRVDPYAPDPGLFPDYDPDAQLRVLLGPGDALYLPPGWFHDVSAPEESISVNCWYGDTLSD